MNMMFLNADGLMMVYDELDGNLGEFGGCEFLSQHLRELFRKHCEGAEWKPLKYMLLDRDEEDGCHENFEDIDLKHYERLITRSRFRFNKELAPGIKEGHCIYSQSKSNEKGQRITEEIETKSGDLMKEKAQAQDPDEDQAPSLEHFRLNFMEFMHLIAKVAMTQRCQDKFGRTLKDFLKNPLNRIYRFLTFLFARIGFEVQMPDAEPGDADGQAVESPKAAGAGGQRSEELTPEAMIEK